jgi:signal transduction histidine kinase
VGFGEVDESVIVLADRGKLEYCLACILQNGIEAVIEGRAWQDAAQKATEHVSVENANATKGAEVRPISETDFDVTVSIRPKDGMGELRVRDRGIGFDEEIKKRLFTPLFTTKTKRGARFENDGMGLFTVRRLIEAMGGSIDAHSAGAMAGAEFTIRLPLTLEV